MRIPLKFSTSRTALPIVGIMALLGFAMAGPAFGADPLSALIARAKAARGPGHVRSLHQIGTIDEAHVTGTCERWQDLATGRYREVVEAGPFTGAHGYDGKTAWRQDAKGYVLPQNGPGSIALNKTDIFDQTEALFTPSYGGAAVTYLGTRSEDGKSYEAISVKPEGGYQEELWFDSATGLLGRIAQTFRGRTTTAAFSDYQSVNGLMVAGKEIVTNESGFNETINWSTIEADVANLDQHLARPGSTPHDYSLAGGEATIPIDIIDDHIFVDVMINGKGPFHFLLDTGASNLMDATIAWQVGAHVLGSVRGGGIGGGTTEMQLAKVDQVALGGATLSEQYFKVVELGPRHLYNPFFFTPKREIQGIIGYGIPARFTTTIDYAAHQLVLRTAQSRPEAVAPSAISAPLVFDGTKPFFGCGIDHVDALCMLDTGAILVYLAQPFVNAHPEIVPKWVTGSGIVARGLGGWSKGKTGQLASFRVGSDTMANVDADFSTDEKGALADPFFAAIVGNRVWKGSALTLDYANARLTLTRTAASASR